MFLLYHTNHLTAVAASISLLFSTSAFTTELDSMKASSFTIEHLTALIALENQVDTTNNFPITDYLVSEKLDGIRAIWTGNELLTRSGHPISAPSWFLSKLPSIPLDGELWLGRDRFQELSQIVLDAKPNSIHWQQVRYMLFDLPCITIPFSERYQELLRISKQFDPTFIRVVEQSEISSLTQLEQWLEIIENESGEGLMLHHKNNFYTNGRTKQLLKLKKHQDAEAVIIGYEEGKGKYQGMLGAVWVRTIDNQIFKIGSGFKDTQRISPPPIGSTIQYRFNGYTNKGLPRFARFVRIRNNPDS
ncbi:DNA ligase [Photobacterium damselae]|nr:DNA ligase [Photobacterium damselae]